MNRLLILGFLVFISSFWSRVSFAQTEEPAGPDADLDVIEAEVHKQTPAQEFAPKKSEAKNDSKNESAPPAKVSTLADLSKLQPFSHVSVLQRRYMPKTGRLHLFAGFTAMTNDPWNNSYGENLRLGYNFTEAWGLEMAYYSMNSTASQASTDLYQQQRVSAQSSFGSMANYLGGSIVWSPIYGKMTLSNKRIIPFDMYFSIGGGSTGLNGGPTGSASGLTLDTGQIFAITRSWGFRWDLNWNMYTAGSAGSTNNLLLTLGACWYFPGVKYR